MAYIHEFKNPIPVITIDGHKGFAIYVKDCGKFENDEWCVCLCEGGIVRHFLSSQIKIEFNATYGILKNI